MNQLNQSYVSQYNSQQLIGCVLLRNSSGSKLCEVVQDKTITKRKTYVKLASSCKSH